MIFRRSYLFFIFLTVVPMAFRAESQEAHMHGLATLTLALENNILEVQFESPAANIVGFEHKANSHKEKAAVAQAEVILNNPNHLFSFVGSDCQSNNTVVDASGLMDEQHDEHKEHSNHDHHPSSEDHNDHDDDSHSEISARYRFTCKDSKNISLISVAFFSEFPGIQKIDAMWITGTKQGSTTLTSTKHSISLR